MSQSPGPGPYLDRSPWWQRDRRWSVPAAVAGVSVVAGAAVASAVSGLAATLGAEAGLGTAAAFTIATGVQLRRAHRGRADDDVETYTHGVDHQLAATGTVAPGPIATVTRTTSTEPVATLHREALQAPEPVDLHTITALVDGRELRLEHRRGSIEDLDSAEGPDAEVPDLVVRWIDHDGHAVAGAHRQHLPREQVHRWTVPAAQLTLHFDVPTDPRRRPTRRTLLDSTGRAFLLTHDVRRRLPILQFAAPPELEAPAVVLCLWLAHLLDAHAAAREPWRAPRDWAVVVDDFPSYVGPGGFGRDFQLHAPGGFGGGGS